MTEDRISGQYNDALFTIFDPPATQKLATEEFITEKLFTYLIYPLKITEESQELILNISMTIISFYITVQSLWIRCQEILTTAIYLP